MKKPTMVLAVAAVLYGPASGAAQVYEHVGGGIGVTANHYPDQGYGLGIGLARTAPAIAFGTGGGVSFGFGFAFGASNYWHGGYLYNAYPFVLQPLHHCWDYIWLDPFHYCGGYHHRGWFDPWWEPVVFFASPRLHFGLYAYGWHSPYWRDPWHDRWAYGGWDPYWGRPGYRTVYYDRGYVYSDRGYVYDRGYAQPRGRVASRSPLFGPRYKEDPRPYVHVSDNGPERPVSRAVPRGDRTASPAIDVVQPAAGRRGGEARAEPGTRTARPRVRARPETGEGARAPATVQPRTPRTRSGGLVVTPGSPVRTARPDPGREDPGTANRPRSSRPTVVTPTRSARPSRSVTPSRDVTPSRSVTPSTGRVRSPVGSVRPSASRTTPQVSRTTPPKVRTRPDAVRPGRVTPSRPSTPAKVRSAPARTGSSAPKVRPAPSRSRSAPPKASSAPPRRSPPKSSPPRRAAPPRRGN